MMHIENGNINSKALNEIKDFRRKILKDLLFQCTESQIRIFNLMYKSIDEISDEKIDWSIRQCERTIEINAKNSGKINAGRN